MSKLRMYPYKIGSESGKDLATLLNILRVKPDGDYVPRIGQVVLNWGNGKNPDWLARANARSVRILNKPDNVNIASNKLSAFQVLQRAGVATPEFTTDMSVAARWLNNSFTVVERHILRGNSGEGIRIANLDDSDMPSNITRAPLYTRFIPKTAEFRVHVFNGQVIDYIEKKKVTSDRRPANFNKYVSSTTCGWVFSRTDVRDMPEVRQIAVKAVNALGLDFGAVDVVYYEGRPYVLEVNTAPGLAGTTLTSYGNALRRFMGQPDLPQTIPQAARPIAANIAQVDRPRVDEDMVTLRLDRATVIKLRNLLANV